MMSQKKKKNSDHIKHKKKQILPLLHVSLIKVIKCCETYEGDIIHSLLEIKNTKLESFCEVC